MAGNPRGSFDSASHLTAGQHELLMAALASNNPKSQKTNDMLSKSAHQPASAGWDQNGLSDFPAPLDPSMGTFSSNAQEFPLDNFIGNPDDSSFLDFLDGNNAEDDEGLGFSLPNGSGDLDEYDNDSPEGEHESHEKRKIPGDDDQIEESDPKRREPGDKVPKKPGRKPLTTEPTNKRKAQNRAAQRAFRERKEKHLKDLEIKVAELEKSEETKDSENALLKAQIARLQDELKEYRKRLSLTSNSLGPSPPLSNGLSSYLTDNAMSNNFSFAFPRFGNAPSNAFTTASPSNASFGSASTNNSNAFVAAMARQDTSGTDASSRNPSRANSSISASQSPASQQNGNGVSIISINNDNLNGLFGGSRANSRSASSDTVAPQSRVFQFNSNANSTASPSASSNSQYGGNSSCGTSPEPFHNSPAMGNKDSSLNTINEHDGGAITKSPINDVSIDATLSNANNNFDAGGIKGIDWFAAQNGGQFDPTLYGDYRDSQVAIVGDGDFTGGFFNDALPVPEFSSPFNWDTFPTLPTGFTPNVQKSNPLEQADMLQAGLEPEPVVSNQPSSEAFNCNKLWDKLQSNPDFQDGNFDIDNLCSELRAKARCSEGGVVVDKKHVDAALKRMPVKQKSNQGALGA